MSTPFCPQSPGEGWCPHQTAFVGFCGRLVSSGTSWLLPPRLGTQWRSMETRKRALGLSGSQILRYKTYKVKSKASWSIWNSYVSICVYIYIHILIYIYTMHLYGCEPYFTQPSCGQATEWPGDKDVPAEVQQGAQLLRHGIAKPWCCSQKVHRESIGFVQIWWFPHRIHVCYTW